MAYPVHDNWYQRRSIRGGRRYAGDRGFQNLYFDGVLESKTSGIQGPYSAEARQDLQNDFNRVISLMEGLITRINNNIAHQAQMAKQSQANLDQHLEQLQNKYLESKKKSDARFDAILKRISTKASKIAHREKEVVDPEDREEVIEQDEVKTNTSVKEIQKTNLTNKYCEEDLEECEEVLENEEEHEDSTEIVVVGNGVSTDIVVVEGEIIEPIVALAVAIVVNPEVEKNEFSVKSENGECMSVRKSKDRPENPKRRYGSMLAVKSVEVDYLGFWKKRKQRRGRMRRRTGRWRHLPTVFPVAYTVIGEHGGEEWPAKVLWRRGRATRYGEGLGLIFGLGFGTQDFAKTAWGTVGLRDGHASGGGAPGVGGGGGGASNGSSWKSKLWVCEERRIIVPRANKRSVLLSVEEGGRIAFESYVTAGSIRTRGTEVKSPNHDKTADVIYSHFSPIPIFGPILCYRQLRIWLAHTSTISLGILKIVEVLARITFHPP